MVLRAARRAKDFWLAYQVFDHRFQFSVVEEITDGQAAADTRDLNCRPYFFADVFEISIA